jgi:hypothetical protein
VHSVCWLPSINPDTSFFVSPQLASVPIHLPNPLAQIIMIRPMGHILRRHEHGGNLNRIIRQMFRKASCALLLAGLASSPSAAQSTIVKRINPPGASYTTAAGLNNTGLVVGTFELPGQQLEAFSYTVGAGKYTAISAPGALYTIALGVNDSGTIAGTFTTPDNITHGFFLNGAKFTQYDLSGAPGTVVHGINNAGDFVGTSGSNGNDRGFLSVGGTVTSFAVNGRPTEAYGINSANTTVGYFINAQANAFHGFSRDSTGHVTQIDFPGSVSTACTSINDAGVVSGFYLDTAGANHGFILANGTYKTSSVPYIAQINNFGSLAGSTVDKSGQTFGILVQPGR